jgi:hypothetical protein
MRANGGTTPEPLPWPVMSGSLQRVTALPIILSFAQRKRVVRGEHSRQRGVAQQSAAKPWEEIVNGLIYLIGLIVVILFILSFFGLR